MTTTNKILPVALVAALLGGTVGAFVMRPSNNTPEIARAEAQKPLVAGEATVNPADEQKNELESQLAEETKNMTAEERAAYRDGFMQGVDAARESNLTTAATTTRVVNRAVPVTRTRTAYRSSAPRRVYYDYGQTRGRSFWQKHRDKLTVAMGAGGGALLGGLIGGKRGAGIGALAGGGGSALYTYKMRKRNRNY
ncbi:MAG: hypothetical protein QOH49_592 [Acidobacteriota bacterium]|jgi:hypothetical protein|nr:hypothetical protein [Acidobacteriota bacterium]